jgi:hypothetical protein
VGDVSYEEERGFGVFRKQSDGGCGIIHEHSSFPMLMGSSGTAATNLKSRREPLEDECDMTKNPWMSMWLSAANIWAGAARGLWAAEITRQQNAMLKELTRPIGSSTKKRGSSRKASTSIRRKPRH